MEIQAEWSLWQGGGSIVVDNGGGENDADGGVGGGDWLSESTDPVLDSLPNSYSDSNVFLCMC